MINRALVADGTEGQSMKKIGTRPLARRNLNDQLAALEGAPKDRQSEHLRRAFEIVEKRTSRDTAKKIVIEAVRAADRAVKSAAQRGLDAARQSALNDFNKNCRAIGNRTKPRLRKEIRMHAARSAFATGAADLETVQLFFWMCKNIVKGWPQDKPACAIFKHLVTVKDDRTHGDVPLEVAPPQPARLLDRRHPKLVGLGRTFVYFVYQEIKEGRLSVRKAGWRTLVLEPDLKAWLGALPNKTST